MAILSATGLPLVPAAKAQAPSVNKASVTILGKPEVGTAADLKAVRAVLPVSPTKFSAAQFRQLLSGQSPSRIPTSVQPWVSQGPGNSSAAQGRNYGTEKIPHTTSPVGGFTPKLNTAAAATPSTSPYSSTGKLWMKKPDGWYVCTASLLGKGVIVTAAHCLVQYGQSNTKATTVYFVPAQYIKPSGISLAELNATGPWGAWVGGKMVIPSCYEAGNCLQQPNGVVGSNDIAVILLNRKNGQTPYQQGLSYYSYGVNTKPYVINGQSIVSQFTQLGYPAALGLTAASRGYSMIRTDAAAAAINFGGAQVALWPSQQTPGCSGGPELVNFGSQPIIQSPPATAGGFTTPNVVAGVTSFGFLDGATQNWTPHLSGTSLFWQTQNYPGSNYSGGGRSWGPGNIGFLMATACGTHGGQAAGLCY